MQKFTRDLTREIEVGGERLAVTLNEEGISVRSVGSRRPPHSMTWAAWLCAVGSDQFNATPSDADLAAALKFLKEGAMSPKPTKPLPAAPKAELPDLLNRLDAWLKKNRSRFHAALMPGIKAGDLTSLRRLVGREIPAELQTLLAWHNGQNDDEWGAFYEAFIFLGDEQIEEAYEESDWRRPWIPFLDDYQGNVICIDPTQPGHPVREVWRGREDHPVTAPSLTAWFEQFVTDVEAGKYSEDEERGEFLKGK